MKYNILFLFFILLANFVSAQNKTLDYFIQQGLQSSPLLKDYQLQIATNKIDSQHIRASYLPQVSASSAGMYAPVVKGWGYDGSLTNLHTFNALLNVSKPFVGKENLTNQFLALQLQNLGLQNQYKISEQDLTRSITQQYITAYGDLLQINFNEELLSLLNNEEVILKKLTETAVYKQTDFLSFLVTVQQQALIIKQLQIQYQNDLATLNYIVGATDTAYVQLQPPNLSNSTLPSLQETVFFQQYKIDSLKIITNDKQVDFSYKPKVNLFTDGGYNSSFLLTPYKNFGISAGVGVTVPIYDGKQRKMQHQKYAISEQNRRNYVEFFSKQYSQQIAQLQQQLELAEQLIGQTASQITYTDGLIKAQRQQLITGDVRIADYIIAIGNYLNAKNIITQQTINKLQITNQINYWNRKQ